MHVTQLTCDMCHMACDMFHVIFEQRRTTKKETNKQFEKHIKTTKNG